MDPGSLDNFPPPPAGQGFQYTMSSSLAAGQEIERCKFFVAPPEGFYINRDQIRYTPGSHHVLLYATSYTSVPTQDVHGATHDTSGVFDCAQGASADWTVTKIISGAQSATADSLVNMPPNIGIKVAGGAVLLMNTHYLNASQNALDTTSKINLYTIPAAQVQQEGGILFFYNPFIRVPAMGQASARLRCPITQDINMINIQSHMHRRGVNYVADLLDGSGAMLEEMYQNSSWENVPVKKWDPSPKVLHGGTFMDYRCDYNNTENRTVLQGGSTRDEMCVLLGSYYPLQQSFDTCAQGIFVGTGQTNGADTLSCIGSAPSNDAFYGCIVNSCPAIAQQMTQTVMCQFTQRQGACKATCAMTPNQCSSCITQACQMQLGALQMAQCI